MHFGFLRWSFLGRRIERRSSSRNASSRLRFASPRVEALDPRQLLTVVTPSVLMISASTVDSKSVTISFDVEAPHTSTPITLGIYRSSDANFSADDVPVESVVALPSVDSTGTALGTVGVHTVTVPIPGGLPLNPEHPYVLVVADPTSTNPTDPPSTASFRTYTIGVVTHGGIQDTAWKKNGPPWTLVMAKSLLDEGYDSVIHYNWVSQSSTPGAAAKQGPILAKEVLAASAKFPSTAPVDIQFIGHSEGAVVNSLAIADASANQTPQLKAGFWEDTLLDPHAANPDFPGRQYSVASGPLGTIAKIVIDNYQARSRDPLAFVPPRVDSSQVFYQQNPANKDHNANAGVYNLWGEVPVKGAATYFNLTPSGIVHGGKSGVYTWYQDRIVPLLGNGAPGLTQVTLSGAKSVASASTSSLIAAAKTSTTPVAPVTSLVSPKFSGKAEPGSTVFIRAGKSNTNQLQTVGQAVTASDGSWTATIAILPSGKYRVVAVSKIIGPIAGKRPVIATVPLGSLVVA